MKRFLVLILLFAIVQGVAAQQVGLITNPNLFDEDGDGFDAFEDCKDVEDDSSCGSSPDCSSEPHCAACINPSQEDVGDGIDNDCNGIIDDDLPKGWIQILDNHLSGGVTLTSDDRIKLLGERAIRSSLALVNAPGVYTAGAHVACSVGTAAIQLHAHDESGQVIHAFGGVGATNGITAVTPADITADMHSLSLVLSTTRGSLCTFDDAFIVQGTRPPQPLPNSDATEATPTGCCAPGSCWNGVACVGDQLSESADLTTAGFRCEDGQWAARIPKFTPDRSERGFCAEDTQCLFNPGGNEDANNQPDRFFIDDDPACIQSGQYIENDLCEAGEWTTRTKRLAIQLLDHITSAGATEYSLFCDSFDAVLGDSNAVASFNNNCNRDGKPTDCINDVCVMTQGDNVFFAAALNVPPSEPTTGFLDQVGAPRDACDGLTGDLFQFCSAFGTHDVWFNPSLNSVIFVPEGTVQPVDPFEAFLTLILAPLEPVQLFVFDGFGDRQPLHSGSENLSFFQTASAYNKLFAARNNNKRAFAFLEEDKQDVPGDTGSKFDYIGINYEGFSFDDDPCALFTDFSTSTTSVQCESDGNTIAVISYREELGETLRDPRRDLIDAWADITAKLQVS